MQTIEHDQEHTDAFAEPLTSFPLPPMDETQTGEPVQNVYNVYVVKQEQDEAQQAPFPIVNEEIPQQPPTHKKKPLLPLALCVLAATAILSGIITGIAAPFLFAPSVGITIIPTQQAITTTSTIILVPGSPAPGQLQGRSLPSYTMSEQQTIPTTGKGHTNAQAATGNITFYNAAPYEQMIPAGTLLIGSDGIQVITNTDAGIPGANMPIVGQGTV